MKTVLGFVFVLFVGVSVCSVAAMGYSPFSTEQVASIMNSSTRYVTSLAGEWERSENGGDWSVVRIPFGEQSTNKLNYRKQVKIGSDVVGRYMWHLNLTGVGDVVELNINDKYIGKFYGGLAPFLIRIPDKVIKAGNNTFQVTITPASDESHRDRRQQLLSMRNYYGLVREPFLIGTPTIMLSDIRSKVSLENGNALVALQAFVSTGSLERIIAGGDSSDQPITLTKAQVSIDAEIRAQSTGATVATTSQQFDVARDRVASKDLFLTVTSPTLWSPLDPQLYDCVVKISTNGQVIDEITIPIGMCDVKPGDVNQQSFITMNGSPLFIKAVEYVEEFGDSGTLSAAQMERDVQLLKTLGVNCVRTRFTPPNPYFVHLCNKYGIIIIIDLPFYDIPSSILSSEEFIARAKNVTERYLAYYDRQPSVFGYNISEGIQEHTSNSDYFFSFIAGMLRKASNKLVLKTVRFRTSSIRTDDVDGVFFLCDRYSLEQDNIKAEVERLAQIAAKPFALVIGKPINPENRNGYADPISVEAQAKYIKAGFLASKDAKSGGITVWSFNDYYLGRATMLTNTANDYICHSGLVDNWRQPRIGFSMFKALLNDEKDPLLTAPTYSESSPLIYLVGGIAVALVLLLMMNRSRRFREYIIRALIHPYNFYTDIRDQRILSTTHTVALCTIIAGTVGIIVSTILYATRMSPTSEYATMLLLPQEGLKSIISSVAWSPVLGTITISALVLIGILLITGILRLGALFVRGRIFFSDTFIITVWSCVPIIVFLPLAIILYRLLDVTSVSLWVGIGVIVSIWVVYRIVKATTVVFDINPLPVYLVSLGVIGIIILFIALSYQYSTAFFAYAQYFFAVIV